MGLSPAVEIPVTSAATVEPVPEYIEEEEEEEDDVVRETDIEVRELFESRNNALAPPPRSVQFSS
jgi:hypothetical protein